MAFYYGAEGCAHDGAVLQTLDFVNLLPADCFVLYDAGGPLTKDKILTPYRRKRTMEGVGFKS